MFGNTTNRKGSIFQSKMLYIGKQQVILTQINAKQFPLCRQSSKRRSTDYIYSYHQFFMLLFLEQLRTRAKFNQKHLCMYEHRLAHMFIDFTSVNLKQSLPFRQCINIFETRNQLMKSSKSPQTLTQNAPTSSVPILLIYYNFKGIGQMIRYLLCYLQIPFQDIFLDEYEKQRATLSKEVLNALKEKSVDRTRLPAIIHNNEIIYDLNQITNYICISYGKEELLGANMYQKVQVCEIQEIYSLKLIWVIRFFSNFVKTVNDSMLDGEALLPYIEEQLVALFKDSGYFRQLSTYLMRQQNQQYVLNTLTVVDFYFIESSRVTVTLFGCLDEALAQGQWVQPSKKYKAMKESSGEKISYVQNLRAMKKFLDFFTSQPFYKRSKAYLQSFNYSPAIMSREHTQGMRKLVASHSMDLYYGGKQ